MVSTTRYLLSNSSFQKFESNTWLWPLLRYLDNSRVCTFTHESKRGDIGFHVLMTKHESILTVVSKCKSIKCNVFWQSFLSVYTQTCYPFLSFLFVCMQEIVLLSTHVSSSHLSHLTIQVRTWNVANLSLSG